MPTYCEPWPGNINVVLRVFIISMPPGHKYRQLQSLKAVAGALMYQRLLALSRKPGALKVNITK